MVKERGWILELATFTKRSEMDRCGVGDFDRIFADAQVRRDSRAELVEIAVDRGVVIWGFGWKGRTLGNYPRPFDAAIYRGIAFGIFAATLGGLCVLDEMDSTGSQLIYGVGDCLGSLYRMLGGFGRPAHWQCGAARLS
jgi:hypothetical protein